MAAIPFDDRDGFIWMDGDMLPWREAKIHYLTHGVHYATHVFEGERAYNGTIFKCSEHSARLKHSAEAIGMNFDFDLDELDRIKYEVMKANDLSDAYIRASAWRGAEQMGIDVGATKTHIAVAAWNWGTYFSEDLLENGISLKSVQYRKPMPLTAPTNSKCSALYVNSTMAKMEATDAGYHDAFMLDHEGYVAESSGANIFFVDNGKLVTPIADRFLNGLTRQTVIEIAGTLGIEVEERRIKPEEIKDFQEVFLTGSAAEVTAVGKIDDTNYQVGQITRKLRDAYTDLVNGRT